MSGDGEWEIWFHGCYDIWAGRRDRGFGKKDDAEIEEERQYLSLFYQYSNKIFFYHQADKKKPGEKFPNRLFAKDIQNSLRDF